MSNILNDFFNPTVKPANAYENTGANNEFRPTPKKGQNGVYEAVIRFLPNPVDPANKSMIQKFTVFMTDPRNGSKHNIDDPRTIGQQSILAQTYFALKGSDHPVLKENAKHFSSKLNVYALIQVLSCKSEPALTNKIMVWRFGQKVLEKINNELNPPMGEPKNPFNLLLGRPFSLKVKEVSGFPNYDACGFFDLGLEQGGFRIQVPDQMGNMQWMSVTQDTVSTEQGRTAVFEYLKNNAPDMSTYEYKPWDSATTDLVNQMVQIYSNPQATVAAMQGQMNTQMATPQVGTQTLGGPMGFGQQQGFSGMPMGQPTQQMPQQAMGLNTSQNVATSTPQMGMSAPSTGMDPRGFNQSPELPGDINSVLGMGMPQASPAPSAPVAGLNLDDVLSGQMIS